MSEEEFISMIKKHSKSKQSKQPVALRVKDVPVRLEHLHEVRDDLRGNLRSFEVRMDSKFKQIDSRFEQIDSRFQQGDSKFKQVDLRFDELKLHMDSKFEKIMSEIHQMKALMEEKNERNKVVMDGLNVIFEHQDRVENRVDEFDKKLSDLKSL